MAVLLDTADVPRRDRADCVVSAIVDATASSHVVLEDPDGDVHARMDLWRLGNAIVFRNESSGIQMSRTPSQVRQCASPVVALAVQELGVGRHEQFGRRRVVTSGELLMTDRTAPYDFSWKGDGASRALEIPLDQLGLPVDVIRRAGVALPTSPLYRLVADHIAQLTREADRLSLDPAAATLGAASIELARALLASAAHDEQQSRAALTETLLTQIRAHVRQHLRDPELRAASIAAAHNISVRQLYKLCAHADFSLEQWIISQRLEGARAELARPGGSRRSVAMIARRWGFSDPTHFTRRFRAAYGLAPRDWRRIALAEEPG
jgi:AraC-like DNA-binding protein